MVLLYVLLTIIGASNACRFIKVESMGRNLATIYVWSLISNVSWAIYWSVSLLSNEKQFLPLTIGVYSKLQVGIAYQASIQELNHIIKFYFKIKIEKDFNEAKL